MRHYWRPANRISYATKGGTERTRASKQAVDRILIRRLLGVVVAIDVGARNHGGVDELTHHGSSVRGGDDCHAAPSCKVSDLPLGTKIPDTRSQCQAPATSV